MNILSTQYKMAHKINDQGKQKKVFILGTTPVLQKINYELTKLTSGFNKAKDGSNFTEA